jgi:Ni/Fe-hydrogenase subunit HybB-like protein
MLQDIIMLAALFILRIVVPLMLVVGIGYAVARRVSGMQLNFSPGFVIAMAVVLALWSMAAITLVLRLVRGIGAVTNLSDATPFGLWIGFDVMAGAMLGGGAFVLAGMVYVFGLEHYRPILRSTILTAFLGYSLLIVALLIDIGRPYNIWRPLIHWNVHSVLFEVAMCVMCYTTVLALEFSPALFERLRWRKAWRIVHKVTLPLVILGIILSTMHQSSLGSLWLITPGKLHDLWYTPLLPVFFWISAITVGLGMVTVESNLTARGLKRGLEQDLLGRLARANAILLAFYAAFKLLDVFARGKAPLLFTPDLNATLFWIEIGLGVIIPAILLSRSKVRQSRNALFAVAALVVMGGILNRLNVSMFGLWQYTGPVYVPSVMEISFSLALLTVGATIFALAVKILPVFPKEEHAAPAL